MANDKIIQYKRHTFHLPGTWYEDLAPTSLVSAIIRFADGTEVTVPATVTLPRDFELYASPEAQAGWPEGVASLALIRTDPAHFANGDDLVTGPDETLLLEVRR